MNARGQQQRSGRRARHRLTFVAVVVAVLGGLLAGTPGGAAPTSPPGAAVAAPTAPGGTAAVGGPVGSDVAADPEDALGVTAGEDWSCSIGDDDGAVTCWGDDRDRESTPPDGSYVEIDAGADHSCGVREDGRLTCWGATPGVNSPPAGVFQAVSAGWRTSCAIAPDDTVTCWGTNGDGQSTAPPGTFGALASGVRHHCGIATDQTITCWGNDTVGQASPPAGTYQAIAAYGNHTCAIATDQTTTCWGDDSDGQASPPPGTYTAIATGGAHTCAIATDQTITCWGDDSDGQASPPSGTYTAIATGGAHTCAIATDRTITCWGDDDAAQASPPTEALSDVVTGVRFGCGLRGDATIDCWGMSDDGLSPPPTGTFETLGAGWKHACGIRTDQTLTCWGAAPHADPAGTYVDVDAGTSHTCAVATDQTLDCWVRDGIGMPPPPAGTYTAVAAGEDRSCALATDQTIACWGDWFEAPPAGTFTQLSVGHGACAIGTDDALTCWGPIDDPPPGEFAQVSVGDGACAIRIDGTHVCWDEEVTALAGQALDEISRGPGDAAWTCGVRSADGRLRCDGIQAILEGSPDVPPPGEGYTPVDPVRVLDTRTDLGLAGAFGPGETRDLQVTGVGGVPADATAVALNVTLTGGSAATDVRLWPAGQPTPNVSNLNGTAGETIANLVIVKIGAGGRVSIRNQSGTAHVIADLSGYHSADGYGYSGGQPFRVVDTRKDIGLSGPFGPGETRTFRLHGDHGTSAIPGTARTAVLNVTVTGPTAATDLRVWPAFGPTPNVSNLNATAGQTIPNLVIAEIGEGGQIRIRNQSGTAHVIIDVVGIHQVDGGSPYHPLVPSRILDTRTDLGLTGPFGPTQTRELTVAGTGGVPTGAQSVVLNVTITGGTAATDLRLWPPSTPPGVVPDASNLNAVAGQTFPNLVVVPLSPDGAIAIRNQSGTAHVIADVVGYHCSTCPTTPT